MTTKNSFEMTNEEFIEDFTTLVAGVANLLLAGIDPESGTIDVIVSDFLCQYIEEDTDEPETATDKGQFVGYVIRHINSQLFLGDKRYLHESALDANDYLNEKVHSAFITQYEILPAYV